MRIDYFIAKVQCKICRLFGGKYSNRSSKEIIRKLFEKSGAVIGDDCAIFSDVRSPESYLIKIGNNVTISSGVHFITHDNCIDRVLEDKSDIFGKINIGNNCFIGTETLIMPGVTLVDKIIVGGGSVVTKSYFENEIVIAGNPARKIGTWEELAAKLGPLSFGEEDFCDGKYKAIMKNPEKIISDR